MTIITIIAIIKITIIVLIILIITKWNEIGDWLRVVAGGFEWFAVSLVSGLQQTYREK